MKMKSTHIKIVVFKNLKTTKSISKFCFPSVRRISIEHLGLLIKFLFQPGIDTMKTYMETLLNR